MSEVGHRGIAADDHGLQHLLPRLGSNEKNVDSLFGEHLLQGQAVALYELDLYPWILRFERG